MKNSAPELLINSKEYFQEMVGDALRHRQVKTFPLASHYLVNLLEFYISSENLFQQSEKTGQRTETLAEMLLKAGSLETSKRREVLKHLGDTTLYISGFFGDSLKRKLVDIDYYVDIGGLAYRSLACQTPEDTYAKVYEEFSMRFLEFVDVLTYISQKVLIQTNEDLLRLYDRYVTTGSALAKEQLVEKGLLTEPVSKKTGLRQ